MREIARSAAGRVLAVRVSEEGEGRDRVQLWASANWHQHLKMEISPMEGKRRFCGVAWHPENPLEVILSSQSTVVKDMIKPSRQFFKGVCFEEKYTPGIAETRDFPF